MNGHLTRLRVYAIPLNRYQVAQQAVGGLLDGGRVFDEGDRAHSLGFERDDAACGCC